MFYRETQNLVIPEPAKPNQLKKAENQINLALEKQAEKKLIGE